MNKKGILWYPPKLQCLTVQHHLLGDSHFLVSLQIKSRHGLVPTNISVGIKDINWNKQPVTLAEFEMYLLNRIDVELMNYITFWENLISMHGNPAYLSLVIICRFDYRKL